MQVLLLKYGYILLFFGVAVEGEAFLLAGAFMARMGYFHLLYVVLVALAANCFADQVYFYIARSRGKPWLDARFGKNSHYQKLIGRVSRHGDWLLLLSRYLYGLRILIPSACGALGMPPVRFTLLNLLASLIWAIPTAILGYYFSGALQPVLENLHHYQVWALGGLLLFAVTLLSLRYLRRLSLFQGLKWSDLHGLVPFLIGAMGLINLLTALLPHAHIRIAPLESWLPLEAQHGRAIMLFAGVALLQVMRGLMRRQELAWYTAVLALAVSLLLHISHGLNLHHSLVAGILLLYLIYFRRRFWARSDPISLGRGLAIIPLLLGLVWIYGALGLHHRYNQYEWPEGATAYEESFRAGILIVDPQIEPLKPAAARFLGSIEIAGWIARLYLLLLFFRPVILRARQEAPPEKIHEIFAREARHSLSVFAIQGDKHHLLVNEGKGLIAYASQGAVAVTCGDPLAPQEFLSSCIGDFLNYARRNGWTPCFYEIAEENLPLYHELGLRSIKLAEEAMLDLPNFSLAGGKRAALRSMVHKMEKRGLQVRRYDRTQQFNPRLDEELEEISEAWLQEKRLSELGFSIGRFSLEELQGRYVFVCGTEERTEAFVSWVPYRQGKAAVLDLMRRRPTAVSGTMDFLLAHSLLLLREEGVEVASLANAPLANTQNPRGPLERGVSQLFENMNSFYGYKNLFQFKNKFAPRWEGRYLIYPRGTELPRVAYALIRIHSRHGLVQLIGRN